jgi:hypothetical protein
MDSSITQTDLAKTKIRPRKSHPGVNKVDTPVYEIVTWSPRFYVDITLQASAEDTNKD